MLQPLIMYIYSFKVGTNENIFFLVAKTVMCTRSKMCFKSWQRSNITETLLIVPFEGSYSFGKFVIAVV